MRYHVLSGIDRLGTGARQLSGRRVGLMTNPTGVDHELVSTIDRIGRDFRLTAMFAVEHGIRGDIQAGKAVDTFVDEATGVTVFSAYGKHCHFSDEMLDAFDVLVFDMQDVGARFYTYLYSLSYAMESCARAGKDVVVLDRVNPLGGVKRCGTVLDTRFSSFVGDYELPTQYALTIGEFARYVRDYLHLDVDVTVVPLQGWRREMYLDDTDLPWVAPSPNCPDLAAALCYIGTCIFEGTNLSEGRGTTQPFQTIGAPLVAGAALEKRMNALGLEGLHFRRTSFCPMFNKHQGALCHGVQMHITDRERSDVFAGGLYLLDTLRDMYPEQVEFLGKNEQGIYTLDRLLGTNAYRTGQCSAKALVEQSREPVRRFGEQTAKYLLY